MHLAGQQRARFLLMPVAQQFKLFARAPEGFQYAADFISPEEERTLVEHISRMEFSEVRMRGVTARRRVRQFGWRYSFESFRLTEGPEVPDFLRPLRARAGEFAGVTAEALSETLVTEYQTGATIGWHRDAPMFGLVVGISLLSACTFRFRRGPGTHEKPLSLELAPRSAYLLDGEARRDWQHSIPATKGLRYSVTFRTLRKGPNRRTAEPRTVEP